MIAQVLIRRWVGIETLVKNNEIAGFKFATVGVIYAVLLAFSVIVVWEKFNDAQTSVAEEAGATAALFRYAEGKEPEALAFRTALVNYLKAAIDEEWPAMGLETEAHGVHERAQHAIFNGARARSIRDERHRGHVGGLPTDRQRDCGAADQAASGDGARARRHLDRAFRRRAANRRFHALSSEAKTWLRRSQ